MPARNAPSSYWLVDAGVMLFAIWTLCCHALVLLGGNGDHLLGVAGVLVLFVGLCVWVPGWSGNLRAQLDTITPAIDLAADESVDRLWSVFAGLFAVTIGAWYWATTDSWLVWIGCLLYALVGAAYLLPRPWASSAADQPARIHAGHEVFVWALTLASAWVTLRMHRDNSDDSFYVNVAVALVDFPKQVLFSVNNLHGLPKPPPAMYHVTSFELLGGTLSRATGIPALHMMHMVLGTLGGAGIALALARLLRLLDPQRWIPMLLAALTLYLFDGSSQFSFAMHGFIRVFQGKAIMWTVLVPLAVVYGVGFARAPSWTRFGMLAAVQVAGVGLSSTGLWLVPVMAVIGVAVGLPWTLGAFRTAAWALASCAYNVGVALWLRARLQGDEPESSVVRVAAESVSGPSFELIERSFQVVLGTPEVYYMAMLALAPALARNRLLRRYLIACSLVCAALLINPFLFTLLRKHLLGSTTYDRALWALPVPVALATCAAALWPAITSGTWAKRVLAGAVGGGLLTAFYTWVPTQPLVRPDEWRYPPEPKVEPVEMEITRVMTAALPPGSYVLAPRSISLHLPLVHGFTHPVIAKETYFSRKQRVRRVTLRDAVVKHGPPVRDERAQWLRAELDEYRVAGVVMSHFASTTPGLVSTLRTVGFERLGSVDQYLLWARVLDSATGPR